MRIIHLQTGREREREKERERRREEEGHVHTDMLTYIVISPLLSLPTSLLPNADRAATASFDATARVWSLQTFECLHVLQGHESWVRSICIHDGHVYTASGDHTARVWNMNTGTHENTYLGHTDWVRSVHVHRHDTSLAITGSFDATVRVWPVRAGVCRKTVSFDSAVRCMCDNSKKLEVVVGCVSGAVSIADISVGVVRIQLQPPQELPVNDVCTWAGNVLAATSAAEVRVWSCDGPLLGVFTQHPAFVSAVSAAPDGTCVSCDGDGCVFVWDASDRRVMVREDAPSRALCCTAVGNDETTTLAFGLEE